MPVCDEHGIFFNEGGFCPSCNSDKISLWKKSEKEKAQHRKKYEATAQRRLSQNHERKNLKASLQYHWRKKIFPYYEKLKLTDFCWINKEHRFHPDIKGRLYSAQVSHYYAKSHLYQLWCDPVNSGICCYRCNVDKPEIVAAMEPMMVEVWGKQRIDDLKGNAEMYLERINKGIDRKYPKDEWFMGMIALVKKMKIS
jgi:hypothetical protein